MTNWEYNRNMPCKYVWCKVAPDSQHCYHEHEMEHRYQSDKASFVIGVSKYLWCCWCGYEKHLEV